MGDFEAVEAKDVSVTIGGTKTTVQEALKNGAGGGSSGVETLPTPSADEYGKIYQYIGETTTDYTKGYFYMCTLDDDSNYVWTEKEVQKPADTDFTGTKAEWEALSTEDKAKYHEKKVNITDDIIDSLSSLIKVKSFTHSDITITQNYGWETFNNTNIDGYTPISAFLSSSSHLFSIPVTFVLNNDSVKLGYSNVYTTSYTGSLTITVVYAKSNSVSKV